MKLFIPFLFLFSFLSAEIYDVSIPENDTASYNYADFRMWVNDSTDTLRGIYWFMHPNNGDSRNIVTDSAYQTLADSQDFALMGAHIFNMHMNTGIGDAVIAAMDSFAVLFRHDEISFIPFFINGYSWGGQFAYHFAKWIPERIVGIITQKGGYHNEEPAGDAIEIPILMFVGEDDLPYRIENLTGIFLEHRPLGAKWALAMEQGAGHSQINDDTFLDSFFHTTSDLRLPDSMDVFQPVSLNILPDSIGWFGDQESWTIGSFDCYDGTMDSSSWLPSRNVGELWQNFVSDGWVNDTSECGQDIGSTPRIPAEWEEQDGIWLQWPLQFEHWMRPEMAALIANIQNFETVHLIVQNQSHLSNAQSQIEDQGGNSIDVTYHIWEHNNAWLRDNGPLYVEQNDELVIHNMQFDAWGGLVSDWEEDNAIPCIIASELGFDCDTLDFIMERGNLEFNGAGTLLTNWDCWADRNPNLDQDILDVYLKDLWGLDQIVWTYGHSEWDVTTGHIDGVARFVNDSTVVVERFTDPTDVDAWIYDSVAVTIENAGFDVVRMDMPGYINYYGWTIPALYLNYLMVEGAIIGNKFNVPEWDNAAQQTLETLFPDREVILLYTPEVCLSGGGIHCITNDQPAINDFVSIQDEKLTPTGFQLHPPYPNPFNPTTTIRFNIPVETIHASSLHIYAITGRLVETLVNGGLVSGEHEISWDASQYSSGVYFVKLTSNGLVETQKIVLVK
jgi:agmatine deiminase